MSACAISNTVDKNHYDEREKRYLELINKYEKSKQHLFPELFADMVMALDGNPEQDFLGEMFMDLRLDYDELKQVFTPYHVCQLMAEIGIGDIVSQVEEEGYVTISDPCCGAGANLIAAINTARHKLEKVGLNYQNHILIVGQDIEEVVALMCYLQISMLGVAGYIKVGNTLTNPISSADTMENYWFTPMYFSDVWHTRRIIHKFTELLLNILNPVFHKFNSIRKKKLELYPGVKETLEKIAGMGIKVVGYTDSAEENGFYRLKRLGIDDYFQSVYVSDSQFALPDYLPASEKTQIVHGKKPNPAVIHKICQQESVAIGEIVYLGDSLTKDVYMARRAGALSVLCKYSYNAKGQDELYSKLVAISHWTATDFEQEKAIKEIRKAENIHPDYTIHAFDEILAIIQTLNTIPS